MLPTILPSTTDTTYNKGHTEATKRKMRKPKAPETVEKFKARRLTEEHRAILKQVNIGKHHSDESREKLRAANLGKKQSEETIAKRAATMTGKKRGSYKKTERSSGWKWSEEAKAKRWPKKP
jgi:hypothetical protein